MKILAQTRFRKLSFLLITGFIMLADLCYSQSFLVGNSEISYTDTTRNNRQISTLVFYPATIEGTNTPVADGMFPVISFGHGFLMDYQAYAYLWEDLVPRGYILAFANTETGFTPSHLNFGLDMVFVLKALVAEGISPESAFFEHIAEKTLVMGHSMGGGCAYIGLSESGFEATAIVSLAASAETTPSAIEAAAQIEIPNLVFAAQADSLTPNNENQIPIYENSGSYCKTYINILGGAHCYFAEVNFTCDLGETLAGSTPTISRNQQHENVLTFLQPYLAYYLNNNTSAWDTFTGLLYNSTDVNYMIDCNTQSSKGRVSTIPFCISPNPTSGATTIDFNQSMTGKTITLELFNAQLQSIEKMTVTDKFNMIINLLHEKPGWYILKISDGEHFWFQKLVKSN